MAISVGNTATSAALTAATGTSSNLSLNNNKTDVIVMVPMRDTRTMATATATYGGVSMTSDIARLRNDGDSTADLRAYIFRLQQAPTGTNNVTVSLSAACDYWCILAAAVSGIHTYGQPEVTGGADADLTAGTSPSVTLTTVTPDAIRFDAVYCKAGTSMTAGSSQTIIGQVNVNGGSDRALGGYIVYTSSGSKTSTYTETAPDDWLMVSAVYRASYWKTQVICY